VKSFKQYIIEKYNFGATAYGNADIDKTTAMEIQKGILKPSWQFLGNKNNPLVAGFSVANNKLPHGTIVKITDKQGNPVGAQFGNTEGIYRVDDTGGKNVYANIDFYSGSNRDMYNYFANLGKNNLVVTPLNLDSNSAEVRNITSRLGQYQGGKSRNCCHKARRRKKGRRRTRGKSICCPHKFSCITNVEGFFRKRSKSSLERNDRKNN
jgi:3D (Asp-Asp-Asp) domain-containing protein